MNLKIENFSFGFKLHLQLLFFLILSNNINQKKVQKKEKHCFLKYKGEKESFYVSFIDLKW